MRTLNEKIWIKTFPITEMSMHKMICRSLRLPGKRRQVVTPDMVIDTRWFRSPYVGVVSFRVRKHMSYSASLSMQNVSSVFSTSWWTDSVALYGSTTVSDTYDLQPHHSIFSQRRKRLRKNLHQGMSLNWKSAWIEMIASRTGQKYIYEKNRGQIRTPWLARIRPCFNSGTVQTQGRSSVRRNVTLEN